MISDGVEDVVADIIEAFMEKDEDKKVSFLVMKNVRSYMLFHLFEGSFVRRLFFHSFNLSGSIY